MRLICLSLAAIFLAAAFYVPAIAGTLEPPPPGNPGEPPLPPLPPPPPPPPLPPAPAKPEKKEPDNTPPDAKKIDEAIKKGVEWLAKLQEKNGSFKVRYGTSYPMGCTALTLLALLKSGVDPRSPVIGRGLG